MKKLSCFLLFGLASIFILTFALEAPASEPGPYVGIFGGYVMPQHLELEVAGRTFRPELDNSGGIGAKLGYTFPASKWLSAELEYAYLAKQDVKNGGGDFKAHNAMFNLVARFLEGSLHPYFGAGAGCSWGMIKSGGLVGLGFVDDTSGAFTWQAMTGISYDFTKNFSADLGYRFIMSKYSWNTNINAGMNGTARNHMVTLGLTYSFGQAKQAAAPPPAAEPAPAPPPPAPLPPAAPLGLKAQPVSDSEIKLAWNASEGAVSYRLYRDGKYILSRPTPDAMDIELKAETKYCYTVTAVDKDGRESVQSSSDCATTLAKPVAPPAPMVINIEFDSNKDVVKEKYYPEIEKVAEYMKAHPDLKGVVEGHTDNVGSADYNLKLSQKRADAVERILTEKYKIASNRLSAKGYGLTMPIADNKTAEGKAKNRRVQAVFQAQK